MPRIILTEKGQMVTEATDLILPYEYVVSHGPNKSEVYRIAKILDSGCGVYAHISDDGISVSDLENIRTYVGKTEPSSKG